VFQRAFARTSDDVPSLWGAVLVALAFGFVGAFVVLPGDAHWGARFAAAVGVATLATVGVWGLLVVVHAAVYRIKGFRDPVWEARWQLSSRTYRSGLRTSGSGISLVCKSSPPVHVSALGHVEAVVRVPDGSLTRRSKQGMAGHDHALGFSIGSPAGGSCEVRWYVTTSRRKRYEITRSTFVLTEEYIDDSHTSRI